MAPIVTLRPEEPGDEPFLFEVYASTRQDELALTGWDENTCRAFLGMQFAAMRRGYASMYPGGEFLIIETGGRPIGRMALNRGKDEIRVIDLALLPEQRNRGTGTFLLQQVCEEAARAGKPVRLSVVRNNHAVRWYERLGFTRSTEEDVYAQMEWRPPTSA